ncbi:hypothetical protein EDD18DRAFT_1156164 [Armillaria luteobubalina]|uniref:Uncharacterized protein n=1 Tax=Armillaria luteobubalina TaxID=153913 RepID=A0AA39UQC0_9AGAR|nr:hypothetical protein EDD18DRAFT_1156164 [Armillaria luteobubalina]
MDFNRPTHHQLGTYFFQHTSFTNETLASFVSEIFEEFCSQINDLGVHVYQQSLEYLHKPDNLFNSCIALIQWDDTQTLRRLALLHPEHSSWSSCIQQLEDSDIDRAQVAKFKAFIQAGHAGAFGEYIVSASSSSASSQEESNGPLQHLVNSAV